tara:strand:- start:229 stop:330 length:102 start_codon:yes stop_codon:yes gene_type:complete
MERKTTGKNTRQTTLEEFGFTFTKEAKPIVEEE